MTIDLIDIAWAAGFIEGDGHIGWHDYKNKHGYPVITADQVNLEPLHKLHRIFGGKLYGPYKTYRQPRGRWEVAGQKSIGIMFTLWSFLSREKQAQVKFAVRNWLDTPQVGGDRRSKHWGKKTDKRED